MEKYVAVTKCIFLFLTSFYVTIFFILDTKSFSFQAGLLFPNARTMILKAFFFCGLSKMASKKDLNIFLHEKITLTFFLYGLKYQVLVVSGCKSLFDEGK